MHSKIVIRSASGSVLGIFPSPLSDHAQQVRELVAQHPGCEYESIAAVDESCGDHPAYEADYCPLCGTAQVVGPS